MIKIHHDGRDFFDPTPEQQNVTVIDAVTLREAERRILRALQCWRRDPFDWILDRVTGSDASVRHYVLKRT